MLLTVPVHGSFLLVIVFFNISPYNCSISTSMLKFKMNGCVILKKVIDAINLEDQSVIKSFTLQIPDQCPSCHTALIPLHLTSYYVEMGDMYNSGFGKLYSFYFCPKCNECFMAHYSITILGSGYQSYGELAFLTPYGDTKLAFSDRISCLSPDFVNIYHQSEKAEQQGLSEICGLGYRKSLEFLIKDYAIASHPDQAGAIKNEMLSPCIQKYIDSAKIKSLALASAWIGNDETHYVRKHEDYGIEQLKAFIAAIVSYIDSELSLLQADALLNSSKGR